ncbi:transglycosylase SLT domain-containing protein [Acinetobacter venetianus]|uniref:transglycosylase SLT domain-containing protein n=1 Tax=Acinetobacter venetianus TaxID=52133 RepID=UPI00214F7FA4|nr:transglycosylase SLT domain-containing protein [Acinetobacter venetianus]MCR4530042.1 transglycosylase SLT domain-containing protein [Acinetobacter venetianus]
MANSFKDPYWTNLSANTEKLLKLPSGLLQNIVLHGERSNADQVSSAGAKTVYQITPTTRNLVLKKYGVDAFLNPKNAAMAAGLLLKESLERNNGNVEAAIGEYHGGTDRSNWGPVNKAYRIRVTNAMGMNQKQQPQQQSSFQRARANFEQNLAPTIAKVYDAYKSGKLNQQQKKDFESDVRAGKIMLPEGAQLIGETKQQAVILPQAISDAYAEGKLNAKQRSDLESDIKAGKVKLPVARKFQQTVPDFSPEGVAQPIPTEQGILPPETPPSTLSEKAFGAGETALTLGTGAIAAPIASVVGTLGQAGREIVGGDFGSPESAQRIAQAAEQAGQNYTYQPRTQAGREQLQTVGEALSPLESLPPVLGGLGVQTATLGKAAIPQGVAAAQRTGQAVAPLVEQATQAAQRPIQAATNAVRTGAQSVREAVGMGRTVDNAAPANIGAAEVPMDQQRLAMFDELGVTPTTAQVSRNPNDLAEMYNMARQGGESGQVITQGLEKQQRDLASTIDDMIESTGAESTNFYATGGKINEALNNQFKVEKVRANKQYEQARKSEGAKAKVDLSSTPKWKEVDVSQADSAGYSLDKTNVFDLINENLDIEGTSVYRNMRNTAVRLGIADEDANGLLKPKPKGQEPTVNTVEEWRQRISELPSDDKDIRAKTRIKKLIDNALDNSGSNAFKEARRTYGEFKNSWTTRSIVKDLIEMKKGANSGDRKVIDEKIVNRITSTATSQDDLDFIKKMITKSPEGQQAWKDLQGTVLNQIRNEAFSGVDDANGSPALLAGKMNNVIEKLDGHTRRLDTLLDKQDADKIRLAGDLAKVLKTVPENTGVNWSNTLNAIAALFDLGLFSSGLPVPVATLLRQYIKHVKDKRQVNRANVIISSLEKSNRKNAKSF